MSRLVELLGYDESPTIASLSVALKLGPLSCTIRRISVRLRIYLGNALRAIQKISGLTLIWAPYLMRRGICATMREQPSSFDKPYSLMRQ